MAQVRKKPSKTDEAVLRAAAMTEDQASAVLAAYGTALNDIMRLRADAKDAVAAVKAEYEAKIAPLIAAAADAARGIEIWATAHRKRLTNNGETKTAKLAAGVLKWRDMPASVKLKRGVDEADVIEQARKLRLGRFLRMTTELNREAMLAEPDAAKLLDGVIVKSAGEKFYPLPFGVELTGLDE